ncbi:hypothetical protein MKW98_009976 [Papaver atlanticum]|uniref:Uncharacterized protein n=1 Tax=Papaver atlanticum TaxID=357466 RepID=A0AAD4XR10_9MAGN|nr:hypothetical protein MKW98_009976 [Papaver atlanticum]
MLREIEVRDKQKSRLVTRTANVHATGNKTTQRCTFTRALWDAILPIKDGEQWQPPNTFKSLLQDWPKVKIHGQKITLIIYTFEIQEEDSGRDVIAQAQSARGGSD